MIKERKLWEQFEKEQLAKENLTIDQKFKLLSALLAEAKSLGILPLSNPLEGIEIDIKIAGVITAISKNSERVGKGGPRCLILIDF